MESLPLSKLDDRTTETTNETFGFKTTRTPNTFNELSEFENKMLNLIQSIEFKNANCELQKYLTQDAKNIKKDNNLLIAADKTEN